ncbi:MAG: cupin domain-containing protein [Sporomusaceae bacterium]|nr:cupin domain-containing protein [Sporomusaceae bacterium]
MHNLFAELPLRQQPEERMDTLLQTAHFCLKRIISTGQASPPDYWYDQDEDEWCVLLTGGAALRFEDRQELVELKPGDWLHIAAHRRHQVAWTKPDEASVWLALHYVPESAP